QGGILEQQLGYWRRQLRGVAALDLPTDSPRPPVWSGRGASVAVHLPAALTRELRRLSQRLESSLFMTLLAAFQVLLSRYSRQRDLAVGTPIAGRTRPEVEALLGFFVNMLVLRADLSGNPSFAQLVARTRAVCLDAYAHQDAPFEVVVEQVQPERDLSRHPLFQVLFVLQNMPVTELRLPGLQVERVALETTSAQFDLALTLSETAAGLEGMVEYSSDLFTAATIERLVAHYAVLLAAIVADPQQPISGLRLLTEAEEHALVVEANAARLAYPSGSSVDRLVAAQAARTPDAPAVIFGAQQLSYAELNARANQLAHELRARGVGPEVRVGIALEPCLELIVALLAVLKAGGCYVPLDPAYPSARLRWLCADSQVALVLTQPRLAATLPVSAVPTLCLDHEWARIAAQPTTACAATLSAEQIAYVIYTSGSTGMPKGVLVPHRGVLSNLTWRQATWPLEAEDRVLLNYSISFDPSVWNIFWPLSAGAALVLVGPEERYDSAALVRVMAEAGITVYGASPSQHAVLLEEPGITACTRLRYVVSGGERLTAEVQARWFARLQATLCNAYGPTEATIDTTYWLCPPEAEPQPALLGQPIPNVQVYVLDAHLNPVPIGVEGELYIGGVSVARGYHQRPDLTAEKFVPDPFSGAVGARLYRTGDLARYRADRQLEFLGRIDGQVKLRGFRIELGEIETVLTRHEAVREAVVLLREDAPGDPRLVAYVVARSGIRSQESAGVPPTPLAPALRTYMQEHLPDYMVPSAFVVLDALPLTPNGKVDRKALSVPEHSRSELAHTFVAPRTLLERQIADLWAAVLKVERVGIHDNFFALGGHSLLATQVASRVRQHTGREVPLRLLFEAPTVAAFAARLGGQQATAALRLTRAPRDGTPLPLSFAQQRLWFLDQLQPGSLIYNLPLVLRLQGSLDRAALRRSLNSIVERHEVLRTSFAQDVSAPGEPPMQVIAPYAALALPCIEVLADDGIDSADALRARVDAELARPFDLGHGPLLRATLFQHDSLDHILVLVLHHSVFDGWSESIFLHELIALYQGFVAGQPVVLPELAIQYADYAVWQRQWLQGGILEQQLGYWRRQLRGVAALDLPTDSPRPPVWSGRGASVAV
ncbi:MAG TPA: amino acid adenylation domain-containing protein, partial [Herpetosiphonaceae bacterium]